MKERLLEFLRAENKSSAQLAEDIGVQASGISHILSGRNNPSLDFVLKMLEKYQFLSTDWLLFGKGSMYKDAKMQNLFDYGTEKERGSDKMQSKGGQIRPDIEFTDIVKSVKPGDHAIPVEKSTSDVIKIVWFYENSSFEEFFPR
jgi:transcriptional regulator with XRE-family HTH domain